MKNILWLTEGLPTAQEPYLGDGIERRAKAVSLYNKVFIVFVKKNKDLKLNKIIFEERIYNENCRAYIYYYPSISKFSPFLDVFLSNFYFINLHRKALRSFKKKYGKPAGIQVNVTMKNGIIALYYKWKWRIHYIVVEGWSSFLPEEKQYLQKKGWLFRLLAHEVLKHASLVITVSKHLGAMIHEHVWPIAYQVIPSVVDKTIFFRAPSTEKKPAFRFIHISNLAPTKNIEQILLAFATIIKEGYQAELLIHAPFNKSLNEQIDALNLQERVILKEEVKQELLADSIRASDALILFSLFETFGNVIIEAQLCGLPVITSDYPTFLEIVEDGVNGIIATGKDASALAPAMARCIQNRERFDPEKISSRAAQLYSFERIGKMFDEVYSLYF